MNIQYGIIAKHDATNVVLNNICLPHQGVSIQILSSTCQGLKESFQHSLPQSFVAFFGLWGEARAFSGEARCSRALRSRKTWLEFGSRADGYPFDKRRVECGLCGRVVMYWKEGCGGVVGSMPNSPQVSVADRRICDVNMPELMKTWTSSRESERRWAELLLTLSLVTILKMLSAANNSLKRMQSSSELLICIFQHWTTIKRIVFTSLNSQPN